MIGRVCRIGDFEIGQRYLSPLATGLRVSCGMIVCAFGVCMRGKECVHGGWHYLADAPNF